MMTNRNLSSGLLPFGLILFMVAARPAPAQLIFQDTFSYSAGSTLASQGGWVASPQGSSIDVADGSLSLEGFAPSSGNSVAFGPTSSASGVENSFTAQNGPNLYLSFMLDVTSVGSLTSTGAEIAGFTQANGAQAGSIWLRPDAAGQGLDIGGTVDPAVPIDWNMGHFYVGTTYQVVEQIQFPRSDNEADVFNAWVNPNGAVLSNWGGVAGPSGLQNSDVPFATPVQNVDGVFLEEGPNSPAFTVDEIRVGETWADVTPTTPEPPVGSLLTIGLLFTVGFTLIRRRRELAI